MVAHVSNGRYTASCLCAALLPDGTSVGSNREQAPSIIRRDKSDDSSGPSALKPWRKSAGGATIAVRADV